MFPRRLILVAILSLFLQAQGADKYTDENRPYEFGFSIDGQDGEREQHRHEKKDERGLIEGEYGFITADGVYHVTVYATDENGNFKILSMKNIRVKPYPGTGGEKKGHSIPFPPSKQVPVTQGPAKPQQNVVEQSPAAPIKSCSHCSIPTPKPPPPQPQLTDIAVVSKDNPAYNSVQSSGNPQQNNNYPQQNQPNYPGQEYPQQGGPQQYPGQQNYQQPGQQNYPQQGQQNYPQQGQQNYPQQGQQNYPQQGQQNYSPGQQSYPQQGQQNYPQQGQQNYPQQGQQNYSPGQQSYPQQDQQSYSPGQDYPAGQQNYNPGQENYPSGGAAPQYPGQGQQGERNPKQYEPGQQEKPQLIYAQMQLVDKDTDIYRRGPGEKEGLPNGLTKQDMKQLLYTFNYTLAFHAHHEEGYTDGTKVGYYYVTGRNGVKTRVDYVADEKGFRPKISQEVLDLLSEDVPKEETEKDAKFGLKGYEFKWLYYPLDSKKR